MKSWPTGRLFSRLAEVRHSRAVGSTLAVD